MPIFLTRQQLYRLLQRELPEGVYPDGAPSAFFSTADMDSVAGAVATAYANLSRVHENNFPQTADERINEWVDKVFVGVSFDPSVTLQDLRDRVIGKIRKQPRINLWEVLTLVASYVPAGTYVQVAEGCGASGEWVLGESLLGVSTFLGPDKTWGELGFSDSYCDELAALGWRLGDARFGDTTLLAGAYGPDLYARQFQSYGYEIRIFGYEVTGTSYAQMVQQLNATEPARSPHLIKQNQSLAAYGLTFPVQDVDFESGVNCITIDNTSQTGYSGLVP